MVNDFGGPKQPLYEGVTVMVDVKTEVPTFVSVNELIFPVPEAARPILGLLFIQL